MQSAKPHLQFRFDTLDISLEVQGQRNLSMTVIDSQSKAQYYQKDIKLQAIGVNTLIKGLQKTKKQIIVTFNAIEQAQLNLLQLKISVESPFLKPVGQTILLKKIRDVSEQQTVKKSLQHLYRKVKSLKQSNQKNKICTYYGGCLQQKHYASGSTYQTLASVKLPKGKYILTFTFLAKAQNQWIYLYFGQGQSVIQNCGYYVPSSAHFIPHTVRKVHSVNQDSEIVSFTTYCASSYPVTLRNAIITAKPIAQ